MTTRKEAENFLRRTRRYFEDSKYHKKVDEEAEERKEKSRREWNRLKVKAKGTLESILGIAPTFDHPFRGDSVIGGPADSVHGGYYTRLRVIVDGEKKKFDFKGIILPDTINKKIIIYTRRHNEMVIHDMESDRWYY